MKIVLIGNYKLLNSKSMNLYSLLLKKVLKLNGHDVKLIYAKPILNKYDLKINFIKKWFGYIDNYIIFGLSLYRKTKGSDLVHICDQANSILYFFLSSKKVILTCHDLIHINLLSKKSLKISTTGKIYQKLIVHYLKKIRTIITVSINTKKELIKFTNIKKKNIEVIYNCLNQDFYKINQNNKKKFLLRKSINYRYLLHVGGNAWYKNREGLIKIFYSFLKFNKRKNYKLILVGDKISPELNKLIKSLNLENKIINIINPPHKDLRNFYSCAYALIFPSIKEGFGWPIIEAQACGCPVFTTNKPPMNEIGLNSVFYLNINNTIKCAKFINSKLEHRNLIIKKGYKNLQRFNINLFTKKLLNIYESVLQK